MSKRIKNVLFDLIILFMIYWIYAGFNNAISIMKTLLSFFNMLLLKVEESSILTYLFKYHITFPIVGLILVGVGIKRGKCGSIIGKILYYIIGNVVAFVLNFISGIIFI